jgi:hypothetical protein
MCESWTISAIVKEKKDSSRSQIRSKVGAVFWLLTTVIYHAMLCYFSHVVARPLRPRITLMITKRTLFVTPISRGETNSSPCDDLRKAPF